MAETKRFSFYDLDGTLISSNVVTQYAWYIRQFPSRARSWAKTAKLVASVPLLLGLDFYSRKTFNVFFFREYRGMRRAWLEEKAPELFEEVIRPAIYPGARDLVAADRAAGFETVLVTGSVDLALGPVVRHFGFDHLIATRLVFESGRATGEIEPPPIAEAEKVSEIRRLCREYNVDAASSKAYSDSMSDLPMLETVGFPSAVNPGRRLRRIATQRGWPVLDLKQR